MWKFSCSAEEIVKRQLLSRERELATFSTIEKALARRKKSFRGRNAAHWPYVVQGCGKMPYSINANMSLKQSGLSHFIPVLAYHCGKKLDDALLLPVFVFMANINFGALRIRMDYKSIGNRPLYIQYDLRFDWSLAAVYL